MNIDGGLDVKHDVDEFGEILRKHDILCVQETWLYDAKEITTQNYLHYSSDRTKKRKARRGSGGVMVFYKYNLRKGVTKINSKNPDCIWVKLDSHFFGLEQDIYLCNAYIVPRNSPYFKQGDNDVLAILKEEITHNNTRGHVLVMGDLNSRRGGGKQEHLYENILDTPDPDSREDTQISQIPVSYRHNKDKYVNDNGKELIEMISEAHMMVLNGRKTGDIHGEMTFHGAQGSSAIDLCITSVNLYNRVLYFKVNSINVLSHHCPLTVALKINRLIFLSKNTQQQIVLSHPYQNTFGIVTAVHNSEMNGVKITTHTS